MALAKVAQWNAGQNHWQKGRGSENPKEATVFVSVGCGVCGDVCMYMCVCVCAQCVWHGMLCVYVCVVCDECVWYVWCMCVWCV